MQRIFNLFKWFGQFLLVGFMILIITLVIFLYKPSLFIDDIEEIASGIINKKLNSNINIDISSINGDFISGFYARNTQINLNSYLMVAIDSIYINPNISDLLLLNLSFSNISLINPTFYHASLRQFNSDYNNIPLNIDIESQFPLDIHVENFFIDNGLYLVDESIYLLEGEFKISYDDKLNLNIENISILSEENEIFNLTSGRLTISKDNIKLSLPDYHILKNNGMTSLNYDLVNKKMTEVDFSFKSFIFPKQGIVENFHINLLHSTQSNLTLNSSFLYDSDKFKSIIEIDLNKLTLGLVSVQMASIPESDAQYNLNIDLSSIDKPNISFQVYEFDYNTVLIDSLELQCNFKGNFKGACEVLSLASLTLPNIKLNNLAGTLEIDKLNYTLRDLRIETDVGNGELIYGQYSPDLHALNCKLKIVHIDKMAKLFNLSPLIEGGVLQLEINYYKNKDSSFTNLNIQSSDFKIDDFSITGSNIKFKEINKKLEYEVNLYNPKISEIRFDTLYLNGGGEKNSYFNSIKGYNNSTGENIDSKLTFLNYDSVNIHYIKGKLKGIPFSSEGIKFSLNDGIISSSPINISFGAGTIYSQIKFLNKKNYLLNLRASEIDLLELKKIFPFQDRIKGQMNGELYLAYEKNEPIILTNLNFRNGNFDDILFENLEIKASYRENRLTLSEVDIDTDIGHLKFSGWLTNTGENNSFKETDLLNISGDFDKFEISYLMNYFPWEQKTTGLLSGEINIGGKASAPRIELKSMIENPLFDKIIAESLSGEIIYKDGRVYLKAINLETLSGNYTGTGSVPANLNFVKMIELDISEQPLDFILTGKSNSLEFLIPYMSGVESMEGDFTMQLGLSGTLKNPIRGGQVSIQNARIELLQLDNKIESVNGVATITNNKLIIKKLSARLLESEADIDLISSAIIALKKTFSNKYENEANNNITVNGSLDLNEFFNPDYTISIDCKDIYLNSTYGQFEGEGDAEIYISGKDTIQVTGEFRPSPHKFRLLSLGDDYQIDMGTNSKERLIEYDIHVPFQDGIIIDTDEINMQVDGDINIISVNNDELTYSGKINIIDGTFNYNNNEFSQATGKLILNPSKSSPYAEINAETKLLDENIDVTFIGFLDNPNLILESSSQQYSQSDILRLLAFKDSNVIEDPSATGQIGELLANYMEKELEKNISLYTELDEFKVNRSGSLISGLDESNIKVSLGKRVSTNLYLNTQINLNQSEKMNEYEVSYRLNRNVSIVARLDEDQYWHINYRYKYKY
tara:strand:+ start:947 stop:4732 length:3786 start_codon:yes stop_codon:yes gene_type:complete